MMHWDGISIDTLFSQSRQEELATDKVKNSCCPGAKRFISGDPTAHMTRRVVERSRKCKINKKRKKIIRQADTYGV